MGCNLTNRSCFMIPVPKHLNWIPPPGILLTIITLLVFPETWVRRVILSGSQVSEDLGGTESETKHQITIHSSVPLPGSVIDYSEDVQEHPSCVIKSVMTESAPEDGKQQFVPLCLGCAEWECTVLFSTKGQTGAPVSQKQNCISIVHCIASSELIQLEYGWMSVRERISVITQHIGDESGPQAPPVWEALYPLKWKSTEQKQIYYVFCNL